MEITACDQKCFWKLSETLRSSWNPISKNSGINIFSFKTTAIGLQVFQNNWNKWWLGNMPLSQLLWKVLQVSASVKKFKWLVNRCFQSLITFCDVFWKKASKVSIDALLLPAVSPRMYMVNSSPGLNYQCWSHAPTQHYSKDTANVLKPGSLTAMLAGTAGLWQTPKIKRLNQETGVHQRTVQLQFSLSTSGLGAAWQIKKVRSWLR